MLFKTREHKATIKADPLILGKVFPSQVGVVFADYYPYPLNLLLRGGAGRPLNPLFISS